MDDKEKDLSSTSSDDDGFPPIKTEVLTRRTRGRRAARTKAPVILNGSPVLTSNPAPANATSSTSLSVKCDATTTANLEEMTNKKDGESQQTSPNETQDLTQPLPDGVSSQPLVGSPKAYQFRLSTLAPVSAGLFNDPPGLKRGSSFDNGVGTPRKLFHSSADLNGLVDTVGNGSSLSSQVPVSLFGAQTSSFYRPSDIPIQLFQNSVPLNGLTNMFQGGIGNRTKSSMDDLLKQAALMDSDLVLPLSPRERSEQLKKFITEHPRSVMAKLDELIKKGMEAKKELLQIRVEQAGALKPRSPERLRNLLKKEKDLEARLSQASKVVDDIEKNTLLLPAELMKVREICLNIMFNYEQLSLYKAEAEEALQRESDGDKKVGKKNKLMNECLASLCIVDQPFPRVLTKGKVLEKPLIVAILTGANETVIPREGQQFVVSTDLDPQKAPGAQNQVVTILNEIRDENRTQLKLKMANGSRMAPVTMKVSIQVKSQQGTVTQLDSNASDPFIIITNENQYEGSNGVLLRRIVFKDRNPDEKGVVVPWHYFANAVQRHFLMTTKQYGMFETDIAASVFSSELPTSAAPDSSDSPKESSAAPKASAPGSPVKSGTKAQRTAAAAAAPDVDAMDDLPGGASLTVQARWISVHEMMYLKERFFKGDYVGGLQIEQFWAWFGKVSQRMRSTRQLSAMWREGLVWAFASREEVEQELKNKPAGSFVVRFSNQQPGMFVVSYKVSRDVEEYYRMKGLPQSTIPSVKHYLIKNDEISIQKTLPDFLQEQTELRYILAVFHNDFVDSSDEEPSPLYQLIPKSDALSKFCSKHDKLALEGYEPSLGPIITVPLGL